MAITNGANMGVMVSGAQGEAHYAEFMKFLRAADGFLMPFVIAQQNSPPGTPSDGDMYIVGTSPTGAWSGNANKIARWWNNGPSWDFFTPREGWGIWNKGAGSFAYFNGSAWGAQAGGIIYKAKHLVNISGGAGSVTITGVDMVNNTPMISVMRLSSVSSSAPEVTLSAGTSSSDIDLAGADGSCLVHVVVFAG